MQNMGSRKDEKRISDLGALGVIREAFQLFSTHAKSFLVIQLALVLPTTIVNGAFAYLLLCQLNLLVQPPSSLPQSPQPVEDGQNPENGFSLGRAPRTAPALELLAFYIAAWLINIATVAVWTSGNLYAVGMIYTRSSLSFVDVMHVIPRLWKRLMMTELFLQLIIFAILVPTTGIGLLIMYALFRTVRTSWVALPILILLSAAYYFIFILAFFYYIVIHHLAGGVSILEENYGWEALKKGFKLLRGKKWVALGVIFLMLLPSVPLQLVMQFEILPGKWSVRYLVELIMFFVAESFLAQFTVLCGGVLYVSFKAHHGEDLSESIFLRGLTRRGYKSMEFSGDGYVLDLERNDLV